MYRSSTFFIKKKETRIRKFLLKTYLSSRNKKNFFILKKSALTFVLKK